MTGTGPSLEDALALYDLGLAPVPAPADDGKSVKGAVARFNKWRRRLSRSETEDLFRKHPGANLAILPHLCRPRLVVVDCDNEEALAAAERRYGPTPLMVQTPRGTGWHLYYRAPTDGQVRQRSLRETEGLAMEIKAGPGAVVVVPPSVRPSTGRPYAFLKGDWSLLDRLPVFRADQLRSVCGNRTGRAGPGEGKVPVGGRNDHLFKRLLRWAPGCETLGGLENIAAVLNERDCEPPLPEAEVAKVARSAWEIQTAGRNWVGRERAVRVPAGDLAALADEPCAWFLLCKLRLEHEGLRGTFAVSPDAMARERVLAGWTVHRYRRAVRVLVERGFLKVVHQGGARRGDPRLFSFPEQAGVMGAGFAPNANKTPSPAPRGATPVPPLVPEEPRRKAA